MVNSTRNLPAKTSLCVMPSPDIEPPDLLCPLYVVYYIVYSEYLIVGWVRGLELGGGDDEEVVGTLKTGAGSG